MGSEKKRAEWLEAKAGDATGSRGRVLSGDYLYRVEKDGQQLRHLLLSADY